MKVTRLSETATIPTRASIGAAGFDLYADSFEVKEDALGVFSCEREDGSIEVPVGTTIKVHTGIAMAIPEGYMGLIFARSGLACKLGIRPANCVGVVDEDYRGEVMVVLHVDENYSQEKMVTLKKGERIAQIIFVRYDAFSMEEVESLDETTRGNKGFGSTGKT